jgi:NitT/TauT family transport system substrate-binding protein
MKQKIVLCLSILALVLGGSNLLAEEKNKVRVALFSWPGYGFWFIAKEKNLAPTIEWDIQIIEDPYESFAQMSAGRLDISSSTSEYGPIAADAKTGIKLVAYTNPSTGTDKIILAPGFEKAEDLKGKSVAVLEGGLTQIFMAMWLEKNGVAFDAVKYLNLIMDDAVAAMVSGTVAAGEFWEPFGGKVLSSLAGSQVVASTAEEEWLKTGLMGDSMYMADAFLQNQPEVAKAAMQGYWAAVDWWRENPEEGNKIIAEAIGFTVPEVVDVIGTGGAPMTSGIYVFDLADAARFMGVLPGNPPLGLQNGQIQQHWKTTSEWWKKFGLTNAMHPIEDGVSFEPIRSLAAEKGKE